MVSTTVRLPYCRHSQCCADWDCRSSASNREHWATGKVVVLLKKQLYRCYALSKHWELKQRLADDSSVASLAFNALGACGYPNASLAFCSMAIQMLWRSVLFFAKLQHLGTFSRAAGMTSCLNSLLKSYIAMGTNLFEEACASLDDPV